jgi:cytochrome P450
VAIAIDRGYLFHKDNSRLGHIPGDYGLPYIGHALSLVNDPYPILKSHYDRFGPISRMRLTGQNMILALGPDLNREITTDPQQLYSNRMGYAGVARGFFGDGLLMQDFDEHRIHRRIMQTAFKTASLQQHILHINEIASRHAASWPADPDFHFYPAIKHVLLEIGARVFVGMERQADIEQMNTAFLNMARGLLSLIRKDWPGLLYHRAMNARHVLERTLTALIPEKRVGNGTDMMSLFSRERKEDGQLFEDSVVVDHIIFLLLGAHDTTTSALTMASYYLARHPEWQERLREEALALDKPHLEYEDISATPNLERVFHEILRMHPPVPQYQRRTVRDTTLGGFEIPADTVIALSPLFTHYMSEFWDDPHRFDPDRFAEPRQEQKRNAYQWVPFGGGAHKCIGMHYAGLLFKCTMFEMLRRYRWQLPQAYPDKPGIMHFPLTTLKDHLPLKFTPL